jgi:TRAP transporter TAXI family solute receptor
MVAGWAVTEVVSQRRSRFQRAPLQRGPRFKRAPDSSAIPSSAALKKSNLYIASGSVGGSFYMIGSALGTVWSREIPGMNCSAQVNSGTGESFVQLANGDADLAIVNCNVPYIGYRGGDPSESTYPDYPGCRALVMTDAGPVVAIARADNAKVTSIKDVINYDLRIGANNPGTVSNILFRSVVSGLGGDPDKVNEFFGGHSETCGALKDGNIDISMNAIGSTFSANAAYLELAASTKMKVLPLGDDVIEIIRKAMPYAVPCTLQSTWMDGMTDNYKTVYFPAPILIDESIDEESVYQMTKYLFEFQDELAQAMSPLARSRRKTPPPICPVRCIPVRRDITKRMVSPFHTSSNF